MVGNLVNYVLLHPTVFAAVVAAVTLAVTGAVTVAGRYVRPRDPDRVRADRLEAEVIDVQARLADALASRDAEQTRLATAERTVAFEREDFNHLSAQYDKLAGDLSVVENRERSLLEAYNELAATLQASEATNATDRDALIEEMNRRDEDNESSFTRLADEAVELSHQLKFRDERIQILTDSNEFVNDVATEFAERIDELEKHVKILRESVDDRCNEVARLHGEVEDREKRLNLAESHASGYETLRGITRAIILGRDHPDAAGVPKFEEGEDFVYVESGRPDKAGRPFWLDGRWNYANKDCAKGGLTAFAPEETVCKPATGAFGLPVGASPSEGAPDGSWLIFDPEVHASWTIDTTGGTSPWGTTVG